MCLPNIFHQLKYHHIYNIFQQNGRETYFDKVDRCPAIYSLRVKPNNTPTEHQMGQQGLYAQESIFWGKNGRFRAKHPNYFEREQNFWYPHIRKPTRHVIQKF